MSSSTPSIDTLDDFALPVRSNESNSSRPSLSQANSNIEEESFLYTGREGHKARASAEKPSNQGDPDPKSSLVCPKCGAHKVAKSRAYGIDGLVMRFIPKRPFRCMRCYHRFWANEPFAAEPKRVRSWMLLLIIAGLAILLLWQMSGNSRPTWSRITSNDSAPISTDSTPSTKFSEGDSDITEVAPFSDNAPDSRQLVEQKGFNSPDVQTANESSSPAQQRLQDIEEAKLLAELAKPENSLPAARPSAPKNASLDERLAITRVEINHRLEQWRRAWEMGDLDRYLSFYSDQFKMPNGQGFEGWRANRAQRISPEREIQIQLSNFSVSETGNANQATVEFDQYYQANDFSEQTRKQLQLNKIDDQWYIISEREISN